MSAVQVVDPPINPETLGRQYYRGEAAVYSNDHHRFDGAAVVALTDGKIGTHAAWNFCGYVWLTDGVWFESVWVHKQMVTTYSSNNLDALIEHVNGRFGHD